MNDERLIRRLRAVEDSSMPRQEFVEDLYATLATDLGLSEREGVGIRMRDARRRRRVGLTLLSAASLVSLTLIGSGLVGRQQTVEPTLIPPAVVDTAAPSGLPSPDVSATSTQTASFQALRSPGRVVFEHWDLPALGLIRLEYLGPDLSGQELLPDVAGVQETPAWSPDGTHLAFAGHDPAGTQPESIWETDAQGSEPRLLSTDCPPQDCLGDRDPAYSPDGRSIAFVRTESSGSAAAKSSVIAIRDLADGSLTKLEATRATSPTDKDRHPSWSHDGSMLAYATIKTGADGIVSGSVASVISVDGTGLRQLAPADLALGDPSWSPDGSVILLTSWPIHEFEVRDVPAVHLYTVKPDGTDLRQLDLDGGSGAPSWSGDGSQILFTKMLGFTRGSGTPDLGAERPNLMVMNRDGTGVQPVTAFGKCCRWYWVQQPTASATALTSSTTRLAAGTYSVLVRAGRARFTVPDGWASVVVGDLDFAIRPPAVPKEDTVRFFFDMRRAMKDAACSEAPEPGVGSSSDALVADLRADGQLDVGKPTPITIGPLTGLFVDVALAPGATRTCPFSNGDRTVPLVVDTVAGEGPFWGVGPNERIRLVILDVPGATNVLVVVDSIAGASFDQLVGATMPVLDTLWFVPR